MSWSLALHPIEAAKQRQYKWWLDVLLPVHVRPRNRVERYRLGILLITLLGIFFSSLIFAFQALRMPIPWLGKISACLMPWIPLGVLFTVRWTGRFRQSAWHFALLAIPLVVIHLFTLRTLTIGFFYWIPWIIVFVNFLAGRWQGFFVTMLTLLATLQLLRVQGVHGPDLGIYRSFDDLFWQLLEHQLLSMFAITAMMYTSALYNDRMEEELERQHVLRAQTAHKSMIGAMLGNLAHEVNNPLAIVHTALFYYQRLLQTRKLEKSLQQGLIQRIGDALDRLRAVVADLNSSADWSDLELPRTHASLQADQHRPPQFSHSRLMSSSEGSEAGAKRQRPVLDRLMQALMEALDKTLPRLTRSWSISQRFRARTAAFLCSLGLIGIMINLGQLFVEQANQTVFGAGYLFLAIGGISMIVLKTVPRPQVIGVGYILLLFLVTVGLVAGRGQSVLSPDLQWFPLMIVSLFMVAKPRAALIASLGLLIVHTILMAWLHRYGFQLSFGQTFPQYRQRLHSILILTPLISFVQSGVFLSLMKSTYSQLVAEKDWHLLSARMRELSELADSAAILIGDPLQRLDQLLDELQVDGENPALLEAMQGAVGRITRVSQSFALLSKPQVQEDSQTIACEIWLEHLHNICTRRAHEAGWHLSTAAEPSHGLMRGPLGRITMLAITCLKEAFGHRAPRPGSPLQFKVSVHDSVTQLHIQYAPSLPSDSPVDQPLELEEAMRVSLLQELLDSLQATLERRQDPHAVILELQWRHADFEENLPP